MTMPDASAQPTLAHLFRKGSKAFDILAATPLILWYALTLSASLRPLQQQFVRLIARPDAQLCLTAFSRGAVLLFAFMAIVILIARRPPQAGAQGLLPRVAGLLGTYLSVAIVLLPPAGVSSLWLGISAAMVLGGMAFACYALIYLGRSFSLMAEARQLVTGGPYAAIRHPLYVGEQVAIVGAAIQVISPAALVLLVLQIGCQIYRMGREEEVLAQAFPAYEGYKAHTARLLPGVY